MHIGGAENWILTLAQQFVHCRPVGLFVTEPHFHPDQIRRARQIMPIDIARDGESIANLRARLVQLCEDADVLIFWGDAKMPAMRFDERGHVKIHIPIVQVSHGDGDWCEVEPDGSLNYKQRNLLAASYQGATQWTAVSAPAATGYPEAVRDHVAILPNGADVNRCVPRRSRETIVKRYGLEGYERIVLFLSRYDSVKNPLLLVEAAKLLPDDWATVFFGHGTMQPDIIEAADGFDNIKVFPPIQHPGDILQCADVMAMPSLAEGHPLTANEAWLAGVPVVAAPFNFAQQHEHLFDIVREDATPEVWAAALQQAVNHNVEGRRRIAMEHYTAPAFAQRWEEYLYAVVGSKLQAGIFGG